MAKDIVDKKRFTPRQMLAFALFAGVVGANIGSKPEPEATIGEVEQETPRRSPIVAVDPSASAASSPSAAHPESRVATAPTSQLQPVVTVPPTNAIESTPTTAHITGPEPTTTAQPDYPSAPFIVRPAVREAYWLSIVADFPSSEPNVASRASTMLEPLIVQGFSIASAASADLAGLRPGLYVAYLGPFGSSAGAKAQCAGVEVVVPGCYVRRLDNGSHFEGEDWWYGPLELSGETFTPSLPEYYEDDFANYDGPAAPIGLTSSATPEQNSEEDSGYEGNGRGPTRCNDGTISDSAGRGTCSHHGGIAG